MHHFSPIPFIILYLLIGAASAEPLASATWRQSSDNLSEYRSLMAFAAPSQFYCLALSQVAVAHAAQFDPASGNCTPLMCIGGANGCRKCRNLNNPALPMIWTRLQQVNCWRTFQHRVDASVSFNRTWSDYTIGFGQGENLNYWMGLDNISRLTSDGGVWRVRWEFSDCKGSTYWAENEFFSVANASDMYRARMGPLDAENSNVAQNTTPDSSVDNQLFSTIDLDNDKNSAENLAQSYSAGWWFGLQTFLNANGVYNNNSKNGTVYEIYYQASSDRRSAIYPLKTFESMLRK